jgi:hypothetical protein
MPNGAHSPQCHTCDFIDQDHRSCTIHDFVLPQLGTEVICGDWRQSQEQVVITEGMQPGMLYYYSYASDAAPLPLERFAALRHLMVSGSIHEDEEFGWCLYLDPLRYRSYPAPGRRAVVQIDERAYAGRVVQAARRRCVGGSRTESGGWASHFETRTQRMLILPDAPGALRAVLDQHYDVAAYRASLAAHWAADQLLASGYFCFVEILEPRKRFRVRPNLNGVRAFLRR